VRLARTPTGAERLFAMVGVVGALLIAGGVLAIVSGPMALGVFGVAVGSLDLYAGWQVRRYIRQKRAAASDGLRELS
jgi:hypothetical protein